MVDGEGRESGSIDSSVLEAGVVSPSFREGFRHGVIRLLAHLLGLIVHDINESSWSRREHPDAFRVVEEGNRRDDRRESFGCELGGLSLERGLEDPVLETLVGEVDAELIERVRPGSEAREVLESGEVEDSDEVGEVISTETFVDVLVEPGEEESVERLGEVVSVG